MMATMSRRGRRELVKTSSWRSVRRGLRLLVIVWVLLTLAGVLVQVLTADLSMRVRLGDRQAAANLALWSFGHQAAYTLFAIALVVVGVRITRAPPESKAIPPALTAAVAFGLVVILNVVVGISQHAPEGARATSDEALRSWLTLLTAARGIGVVGLLLAAQRLCAAVEKPRGFWLSRVAIGLAVLDGVVPIYRLLAHDSASVADTRPWLYRGFVLGLQLAVAFFVIDTAVQAYREAPDSEAEPVDEDDDEERDDDDDEEQDEEEPEAEVEPPVEEKEEEEEPEDPDEEEPTPQSPRERLVGAVALVMGIGLLPLWDALRRGGFGDALSGAAGTTFPVETVVYLAGSVLAALVVHRSMSRSPYGARVVFGISAAIALLYLGRTGWHTAVSRSHQVDGWAVCETMAGPDGEIVEPNPSFDPTAYDGPRLPSGQPCSALIEERADHRAEHPEGSFRDGLVQNLAVFPQGPAPGLHRVAPGALGARDLGSDRGTSGSVSVPERLKGAIFSGGLPVF